MTRTQISLTEDQYRFLAECSRQTGESLSAIVRRAIDRLRAQEEPPRRRLLALIGAYEADRSDVAERHDEILWGRPAGAGAPPARRRVKRAGRGAKQSR